MKVVIIVQARMTSTRLPGKILLPVLGKPLLEYQIERLKRCNKADEIVIATTTNGSDQPVVDLCERIGIVYYRGSECDVLARYFGAAVASQADVVVRVTSDCPVIDPTVIKQCIDFYLKHYPYYDYVSNSLQRTYPRGMDTEVFSFAALEEAYKEAVDQPEREHVTPFLYRRPVRYRLGNICYHQDYSNHRWTVDTVEDFQLISLLIEHLYLVNNEFSLEDMLLLLQKHPEWATLNAAIEQKKLGE